MAYPKTTKTCSCDALVHSNGLCRKCYFKDWYAKRTKKDPAYKRRQGRKDLRKRSDYKRKYYLKNRKKMLDQGRDKRRALQMKIIGLMGGKCECCEETRIEFLTLDHVKNNGGSHRREVGDVYYWLQRRKFKKSKLLRVLCMNCNWGRQRYGICPHERERQVAPLRALA